MRERSLLYLFLGLNVALAGAFVIYLFLSTNRQPEVVATSFVPTAKTNAMRSTQAVNVAKTNAVVATTNKSAVAAPVTTTNAPTAVAAVAKPTVTSKKF